MVNKFRTQSAKQSGRQMGSTIVEIADQLRILISVSFDGTQTQPTKECLQSQRRRGHNLYQMTKQDVYRGQKIEFLQNVPDFVFYLFTHPLAKIAKKPLIRPLG